MEIKKLDPAQWRGYGFTAWYQTGGCWDIVPVEEGFRIEYHSFGKVEERSFKDTLRTILYSCTCDRRCDLCNLYLYMLCNWNCRIFL